MVLFMSMLGNPHLGTRPSWWVLYPLSISPAWEISDCYSLYDLKIIQLLRPCWRMVDRKKKKKKVTATVTPFALTTPAVSHGGSQHPPPLNCSWRSSTYWWPQGSASWTLNSHFASKHTSCLDPFLNPILTMSFTSCQKLKDVLT